MGASGSSSKSSVSGGLKAEYQTCLALFNSGEQQEFLDSFTSICDSIDEPDGSDSESKHSGTNGFTLAQYKKFIGSKLPEDISRRLFHQMWLHQGAFKKPEETVISREAFIVTLGKAMRGTTEEQSHIVIALSSDKDAIKGIYRDDIEKLVADLLAAYERLLEVEGHKRGWRAGATEKQNERFVKYIMKPTLQESSSDEPKVLTESEVQSWLHHTAMFQLLLTHVIYLSVSQAPPEKLPENSSVSMDLSTQPSLLPVAQDIPWNKISTLLDIPSILLLNRHLPHQHKLQWRFLYSSSLHGASFATFLSFIKDKGPMLLVVKDSKGQVFGSFISESIDLGPAFTGSAQSFLFTLTPDLGIYESSGKNDHYVYLNIDQQTLPNGLGMGGQFGHFGFFLSQDFGKGNSKGTPSCTTYDSPQLSADEEFEFDVLEAWALGPPPKAKTTEETDDPKQSILDKDPEAQAILEMVGRGRKSEGLREGDATAGIPEVHELPPM